MGGLDALGSLDAVGGLDAVDPVGGVEPGSGVEPEIVFASVLYSLTFTYFIDKAEFFLELEPKKCLDTSDATLKLITVSGGLVVAVVA